jgi:hypothetical protein
LAVDHAQDFVLVVVLVLGLEVGFCGASSVLRTGVREIFVPKNGQNLRISLDCA